MPHNELFQLFSELLQIRDVRTAKEVEELTNEECPTSVAAIDYGRQDAVSSSDDDDANASGLTQDTSPESSDAETRLARDEALARSLAESFGQRQRTRRSVPRVNYAEDDPHKTLNKGRADGSSTASKKHSGRKPADGQIVQSHLGDGPVLETLSAEASGLRVAIKKHTKRAEEDMNLTNSEDAISKHFKSESKLETDRPKVSDGQICSGNCDGLNESSVEGSHQEAADVYNDSSVFSSDPKVTVKTELPDDTGVPMSSSSSALLSSSVGGVAKGRLREAASTGGLGTVGAATVVTLNADLSVKVEPLGEILASPITADTIGTGETIEDTLKQVLSHDAIRGTTGQVKTESPQEQGRKISQAGNGQLHPNLQPCSVVLERWTGESICKITQPTEVVPDSSGNDAVAIVGPERELASGDDLSAPVTSLKNNRRTDPATGVTYWPCDVCERRFRNRSGLRNHKAKKHRKGYLGPEGMHQCQFCEKKFQYSTHLQVHERIHTGEKPFKCKYCGKRFNQKSNLRGHIRTHTGEKPHKCSECGKAFMWGDSLKLHMLRHGGERPFKCEVCGKGFVSNSYLVSHLIVHSEEKPYKCEKCNKAYKTKSHLREHSIIHTDEKPFKCEHCEESFRYKQGLQAHLVSHGKVEMFKCDKCDMQFRWKGSLNYHQHIHTREYPYTCEHCGKSFARKGYMKIHMRIHSGEKPFDCEQCGKSFSTTGTLKRHLKVHTMEKPYTCDICNQGFTWKESLSAHMISHTGGEKPYACETCGTKFKWKISLNQHHRRLKAQGRTCQKKAEKEREEKNEKDASSSEECEMGVEVSGNKNQIRSATVAGVTKDHD